MSQGSPIVRQFGNGMVEISAVATLIGAPIAESFTVGLKSAACLPWASISSFGLLHVAKAALAAAVPDWLREALGLKNENVEAAIGLCLPLYEEKQARSRVDLGDIKAIGIDYDDDSNHDVDTDGDLPSGVERVNGLNLFSSLSTRLSWSTQQSKEVPSPAQERGPGPVCFYHLDRTLTLALDTIPHAEGGSEILVHEFVFDRAGQNKARKDWLALMCSLSKVAETVTLRALGANTLYWLTASAWAYGFAAGAVLTILRQSRELGPNLRLDMVSGRLPSPLHQGGDGKIVLGLPRNVRRGPSWRSMWYMYTIVSVVDVIGTFLVLGQNRAEVVYVWLAFQFLWLLARTLVFYLVESAAGAHQGLAVGRTWDQCPIPLRERTIRLVMALARQQTTLHPRGVQAYRDDLMNEKTIGSLFNTAGWSLTEELPIPNNFAGPLAVVDVVGDTVLRTVNWTSGANLNNADLYDAVLVIIKVDGNFFAVPAVRVSVSWCRKHKRSRQRGDSHGEICAKTEEWVLWIPAIVQGENEKRWLYAHGSKIRGTLEVESLSAEDLDRRLATGEWLISFEKIGDLEAVLHVSRKTSWLFMNLMLGLFAPQNAPKQK
jgi:hypothetical protein